MQYQKKCEECGHTITAYTLPMNEGLAHVFKAFAEKYLEKREPIKKGDVRMSNSQYTNFQNLRYFGLIKQAERGAEWELTPTGEQFYNGDIGILSPCGHMAGRSLDEDHEAWKTHDKPRKYVRLDDVLERRYKQRKEYQEEKLPTIEII